jgi:nicotinamidase-related amidase
MSARNAALIVIDIQNDYFPSGKFPLWNAEDALANIEQAIAKAQARKIPVILVQHVADSAKGPAPFFKAGSKGVELHPRIKAAAPSSPLVTKSHADAFFETSLEATLRELDVDELLVCGMIPAQDRPERSLDAAGAGACRRSVRRPGGVNYARALRFSIISTKRAKR